MYEESSEARKSTAFASSSGSPHRPRGIVEEYKSVSLADCSADLEARASVAVRAHLLQSHISGVIYGIPIGACMGDKTDVWLGTLSLMVLTTLETLGPLHGFGIARRIEQTSGDVLSLNYGTLYPALRKLEQEGAISSEWGASENNRKAKFYKLT